MTEVVALAMKDIRLLLRDKSGFFFTFFFPLIMAVFFGSMFSGTGGGGRAGLRVVVVDDDASARSKAFVDSLETAPELRVIRADRTAAIEDVRRGRRVAYIVLKKGFGEEWNKLFQGRLEMEIGVDPTREAEAGLLQSVLVYRASQRLQSMFGNIGAGGGFEPVFLDYHDVSVRREGPNNAYAISFPQGIIWGIIGAAAAFGISIVVERTHGTLMRLLISPVPRMKILLGKALACFLTTVTLTTTLFVIAIVVFGVRPTSIPLLALAVLSGSVCFVGIMMLLSVMGRTERSAGGIGWAVLLLMSMTGGGMIPLFAMPAWMLKVSNFSAVKWAILAMEGAIWRSFSVSEMLLPCGILVSIGVVAFIVGAKTFHWTQQV